MREKSDMQAGQSKLQEPRDLRGLNADALAFMGDAVFESAVRERVLARGITRADTLHRIATGYVCAQAQARVCKELFDELEETEQALVKRCRNHKYHSKAKNADPMTYKWATAFEALIGYLYLAGEEQRLDQLLQKSFEIIESEN